MSSGASFFYNKTINIFTDASCKELRPVKVNVVKATSPGFVATYAGRMLASGLDVYLTEHSMYGEAKGIELAVDWCKMAASRGLFLPDGYSILSDNEPVIITIYNYLTNWFNKVNTNKSSEVLNQQKTSGVTWKDVAFNTALSIFTSGLPIRIFYVASHVNVTHFSPIQPQEKFLRINYKIHGDLIENIDEVILHDFATFNNIVDIMTRNYLVLHKSKIENDIDTYFNYLNLDDDKDKRKPLRWPFNTFSIPHIQSTNSLPLLLNQYLV